MVYGGSYKKNRKDMIIFMGVYCKTTLKFFFYTKLF